MFMIHVLLQRKHGMPHAKVPNIIREGTTAFRVAFWDLHCVMRTKGSKPCFPSARLTEIYSSFRCPAAYKPACSKRVGP